MDNTNSSPLLPDPEGNEPEKKHDIDKEWADALHLEYDKEEAEARATKAAQTPPPYRAPQPASPGFPPPGQQPPVWNGTVPQPFGHPEPMPPTYLLWSVLTTVLCCSIPGIIGIVYSAMVSGRYYAKDYEGARRASRNAQICIIASVVLGLITATVYIPLSLLVN